MGLLSKAHRVYKNVYPHLQHNEFSTIDINVELLLKTSIRGKTPVVQKPGVIKVKPPRLIGAEEYFRVYGLKLATMSPKFSMTQETFWA